MFFSSLLFMRVFLIACLALLVLGSEGGLQAASAPKALVSFGLQKLPKDGQFSGVAYGAGKFAALVLPGPGAGAGAGDSGCRVATSVNGVTWFLGGRDLGVALLASSGAASSKASSGASSKASSTTLGGGSGGGVFVAVSKGGLVATGSSAVAAFVSADAVTWSEVAGFPECGGVYDLTYAGGRYLALGWRIVEKVVSKLVPAYDEGGVQVTDAYGVPLYNQVNEDVSYPGLFIFESANGTVWSEFAVDTGVGFDAEDDGASVSFGGGTYAVVGRKVSGGWQAACTKSAPGPWQMAGLGAELERVRFLNGRFLAVGDSAIYSSTDGAVWKKGTLPGVAVGVLKDVALLPSGAFVAVGGGGLILASANGEAWSLAPSGVWSNLSGVALGGRKVAVTGPYEGVLLSR